MTPVFIILISTAVLLLIFYAFRRLNKDHKAQIELDNYMKASHSPLEIGRLYERYIGYLYEADGLNVEYHGAVKGFADLGRDLIVRKGNDVSIIQTKYWQKHKEIQEKDIFQLFGSMTHFKRTSRMKSGSVKAVFYTTAKYSKRAKEVADVLEVDLRYEKYNRSYPMIKCNVSANGEKIYYLPFDTDYDKVKIEPVRGSFFTKTVKEAVEKGFSRAGKYTKAA